MLARLNAVTHPHHASADASWLALLRTDVGRMDYMRQLVVTYGFEAPLESALSYTRGLAGLLNLRARSRCGLLVQDLLALGHTPADVTGLPQCFSITAFEDIAEALGWLYVVERASLHHEPIRRNVTLRGPAARNATSYLTACGSIAGARWQAFGRALDTHATSDTIAERIVAATEHAYRRLYDWNDTQTSQLRSVG